jgi:uncharacterized damage-inducible protein DinB
MISELLLPEWDLEIATTRRVLERTPDDGNWGTWKPHEKAFPMAHLAQLVSMLPGWVTMVIDRTEFDVAPPDRPKTGAYSIEKTAKLLADFDENAKKGREAIARTSDADFHVQWEFKAGGRTMSTQSRYIAVRTMVINHLVHHRAQLGLYLRLADLKVPSMYGPTADDKKF